MRIYRRTCQLVIAFDYSRACLSPSECVASAEKAMKELRRTINVGMPAFTKLVGVESKQVGIVEDIGEAPVVVGPPIKGEHAPTGQRRSGSKKVARAKVVAKLVNI